MIRLLVAMYEHEKKKTFQVDWLVRPDQIAAIQFTTGTPRRAIVHMAVANGHAGLKLEVTDPPSIDRLADLERS